MQRLLLKFVGALSAVALVKTVLPVLPPVADLLLGVTALDEAGELDGHLFALMCV
jgi:uncharacterized protein YqgC (DUF456 family)